MITTKIGPNSELQMAIETALARIPPLWPLQRFVAVNPFLGMVGLPFEDASRILAGATGVLPLMKPEEYRAAFLSGEITRQHLEHVATDLWTVERLIDFVEREKLDAQGAMIPTIADLLDQTRPRAHWATFIVEEISKWCAVHFDRNQTTWTSPWRDKGLFTAWREGAAIDRNPEAFGLLGLRAFVADLPEEADEAIGWCLERLPLPGDVNATDFFHRQLMTIPGWAGYAQYLAREDQLYGRKNLVLRDLLAIRLAYDAALYAAFEQETDLQERAKRWTADWRQEDVEALSRWQAAYEFGLQRTLGHSLASAKAPTQPQRPGVQAVFCIDVRSEVFRRHLESVAPNIQTIGFAGFFGFPVAYRDSASMESTARCPVLLTPVSTTVPTLSDGEAEKRYATRNMVGAWKAFQHSAASCFTFVEACGLFFTSKLGLEEKSHCGCSHEKPPQLMDNDAHPEDLKVTLALGALKNMGLNSFARLVLICGHGSQSANNPYASALDCGACGGHAGDVNARLAAATLNDATVRATLAERGVRLPEDTVFIAGIHNTVTDEVTIFESANVPSSHQRDLADLREALAQASHLSRIERAGNLDLDASQVHQLASNLTCRASDISQVRPEWGLANNAAFIAAPRWRTSGMKLSGRVFLHDYASERDTDSSVLTLILSAPVVVASWINLQYYASRVQPDLFGSGNKTLHNVTGGLGVMEGNSGDLRPGLPLQSIHDGTRFMHEARRLSVYIEARREKIDAILNAHPDVCDLFRNAWLHLFALEGNEAFRWTRAGWQSLVRAEIFPR